MNKTLLLSAIGAVATIAAAPAGAQEITGRVLSSTPIVQQVQVPRQVCSNQPVAVQQPRSGAGTAIGAIAGGLLGNTIGGGSGRAAATVLGVIGGAVVGDRIEGNGNVAQVQNVASCTTQTTLENRTVAYNVTYEYAGQQYSVQMPQDPGPTIRLQLSPVGASTTPPAADPYASGVYPQGVYPQGVQPLPQVIMPSTVAYPSYYASPYYYPPVGVSLGIGYYRGYGHRGHRWH
ncbi:MAG: glycine zipper 2TM domain-containing protein [Burkholderiales bacterium]|nr:glycine zipper 2TM domain-containing protein [Burkholderiales bacterium]